MRLTYPGCLGLPRRGKHGTAAQHYTYAYLGSAREIV